MPRKRRKSKKRKKKVDCEKELRKLCRNKEKIVLLFDRIDYLLPSIPSIAKGCPGHEEVKEIKEMLGEVKKKIANLVGICEERKT